MVTATFPISNTGRNHSYFPQPYKEVRDDGAEIVSPGRNRFPSDTRVTDETAFHEIIGASPALKSVLADVERVVPTDSTLLVLGETGAGKELIAGAICYLSARRGRPFVKISCAVIPFDLLESEFVWPREGCLYRGSDAENWPFRDGGYGHRLS